MRLTTDEFNIVNLLVPKDRTGVTGTSVCFNMKDYESGIVVLQFGNLASTVTLAVENCTAVAGTSHTAIPFTYRLTSAATPDSVASDTYGARVAVAIADQPIACGAMDNMLMAIELKSEDLTDGYPYVWLSFVHAAAASLTSAIAILKPRYPQKAMVTALS